MRLSPSLILALLAPVAVSLVTASAWAADGGVDYAEYAALVEAVGDAQGALDRASETARREQRETAVAAYQELLAWLRAFFVTEDFRGLDEEARRLVQGDFETGTVSLARILAEGGDCLDALSLVDDLLAAAVSNDRRDWIRQSGGQLDGCPAQGWLAVVVSPNAASASIDGAAINVAGRPERVDAGPGWLRIEADGFGIVEQPVDVVAGAETTVGPIWLQPLPDEPPPDERWVDRVEPEEWALWGVGAASIGVGIGYLVYAGNRSSELSDLEEQGAILLDPGHEREVVRDMRMVGFISLAVGLAAATAGTVLYVNRNGESDEPASGGEPQLDFEVSLEGASMQLGWDF